ncbi:MAG: metal-dependent hydrolase [Desulfobulbaceae bacterium]|nr:MAG: metal-dependent hydrolase [Desulfobulbaceae bacterium]
MDSVTQAALGASVGFLCWRDKLGRKAVIGGAVIGTIPDLDIIVYPLLDSVQRLYWHRGESHSVFFILLGALLTGWVLQQIIHRHRISYYSVFAGCFLIYATHVLIDVYTVYGTQLFAPFSRYGYALGNMFIIDPLLTLPLLLSISAALVSPSRASGIINSGALFIVICYSIWSLLIQSYADKQFQQALVKMNVVASRNLTSASPLNTLLWRHVAETPDGYLFGYWSILDQPEREIVFYHIPRNEQATASFRQSRAFAVVDWFSKGWWIALETGENRVKIVDIRFTEIPASANDPYQRWNWPFSWVFEKDSQPSQLQRAEQLPQDFSGTLELLTNRINGGTGWLNHTP